MTLQKQSNNQISSFDEQILVVKREKLLFDQDWQGLKTQTDFSKYLTIIQTHQEFHSRSVMENDPSYKQIIPYLIFTYDNKYFLMQRQAKATEQRLKNKYSLGIGGHINKEDICQADIMQWGKREFNEEVNYTGSLNIKPIGILNDDSNDVGKVHIGFVFLLEGDSADISVKSELKSGELYTLDECTKLKNNMENWSQLILPALKNL